MGGGGVLVAWGARGASRLWQCVVAYLAVSSALWTAVHPRVGEGNPAFWSTVGAVSLVAGGLAGAAFSLGVCAQ